MSPDGKELHTGTPWHFGLVVATRRPPGVPHDRAIICEATRAAFKRAYIN